MARQQAPRSLWVRGATIIDGTEGASITGDVVVDDAGLITSVGPALRQAPFDVASTVDGAGYVLAPGFIDLHSHSDLYTLFRDSPGTPPIGDSPKLVQGCTAQVFGQDGISAAPVSEDDIGDHMAFLAGLDGTIPDEAWTWRAFADYHRAVTASSTTRTALLVGHATIRRLVMGDIAREASAADIEAMQQVLATALDEGGQGFSTGLVYVPAAYATTDEVAALCEVVAARQLPFFVHVRSESDGVVEATDEVLEIAARTGCHLHYSHIKAAGRDNWHKASVLIERIAAAREAGVSISADVHPYIAGSTSAIVLLPPWVQDGGHEAAIARLSDPGVRAKLRLQLMEDTTSWDNWWRFSDGWSGLKVARSRRPELVGRSFAEVISAAGVSDLASKEAFDAIFDLLVNENLGMSLVSFNNVEENVARFMSQPYTSIGTDAVVDHGGHPHPRLHGTFPRVLGRFVRELGALSLEEAVRKVTSQAAAVVGWAGVLGEIRPGLPADLVLFDRDVIADRATFESPWEYPVGIEGVWVGGWRVVQDGDLTPGADVVAGRAPEAVAGGADQRS
ncbi:MAG TPA: D-aminoacylase [Acidimicrobiales bacterium]|nr:D-aminoacylase [Acidimicrobiales bacterium]